MKTYDKGFETWFNTIYVKNNYEGGIANRPKNEDPAGLTNKGIVWKYFSAGNWGKWINKPSTAETFYNLTNSEVKAIAYNQFYKVFQIDKLNSDRLKPLAMDTVWGSGNLKSLGASTVNGLNTLINKGKTFEDFVADRRAFLQRLPNAKYNAGWFSRLNSVVGESTSTLFSTLFVFFVLFFLFYKK